MHLEIGAGTRYYPTASSARLAKGVKLVSLLDLNPNTLVYARKRLANTGYRRDIETVHHDVFDALPETLRGGTTRWHSCISSIACLGRSQRKRRTCLKPPSRRSRKVACSAKASLMMHKTQLRDCAWPLSRHLRSTNYALWASSRCSLRAGRRSNRVGFSPYTSPHISLLVVALQQNISVVMMVALDRVLLAYARMGLTPARRI
ncbi:hypothetical protein PYCCODRAFT_809413 [Trametes coccinea BRFM310]|uniref:Methyltransferase type 11 domain-containing protein n=1 Tax=Trametes coccinea (strain BRFM310) TaxID=1353009 RepID=A0A1Y2IEM9_TRAC3|nr:hypothetical protein PYCCODRAFT_809413 [Trametes coccinea BRFM310]